MRIGDCGSDVCSSDLVSLDHVLLDPQSKMQIVTERAIPVEVRAASLGLCDGVSSGFAAFEQYVDDPAWPQGPWTDIYGMSALARCLILKQSPPDAVQRMVSDGCEPLRDMGLPDYSREFLDSLYLGMRSEERRVGTECVRTCRSRWAP